MVDFLRDIVNIIQIHFKMTIDEESTPFMRLITHLQFFLQRLLKQEEQQDDLMALEMYREICKTHVDAYACVQKIKIYIESQFGTKIMANEETYLMIHINHLVRV